jgi:branched-chain amino acid transport system substrate-binding protein
MDRLLRKLTPLACALALAACSSGGEDDRDAAARARGMTLTVYSSLPRHGVSAQITRAVAAGQRRALADARGRVGRYRVRFVELDSTRPGDPIWDPGMVDANAKRARDDPTTIAYLGELDYGASAVSLPVTNGAGILQVSPGDGLTSLTRRVPGRSREGPDRYYPTGRRTFVRLVPSDLLRVERLLAVARAAGGRRLALVSGEGIYGRELTAQLAALAPRAGLRVAVTEDLEQDPKGHVELAAELARHRPDTVVVAAVAGSAVAPLLAELGRRLPRADFLSPSTLLLSGRALRLASRLTALSAVRPRYMYPAGATRLLRALGGRGGASASPYALYGYESMRLALDAIEAGGASRAAGVRAALASRGRRSAIGTYSVGRTGDVSERRFAVYRLRGGRLVYERAVR